MHRALLSLMLLTAACGSNSASPTDTPTTTVTLTGASSPMSAVIGGVQWNSLPQVGVTYLPSGNVLSVNGTDTSGTPNASTRTLGFYINPIAGTGTYGINEGNQAQVMDGSRVWQAGGSSGGSGAVIITSLSTHRATGSFSFVLNPTGGGATGTKAVTGGAFDVSY
jgi:hypothetical protein